jgi:apolipoprotein N-acyltransferase
MRSKGLVASVVSAVVSAVLLFASFPPLGEKVDILFALVPILIVSRLSNVKRSAMIWGLAGVLFWGSSLSWLVAISKNGGPLPLVILGLIGLSAICGAYFAAFGALDAMMWRRVSRLHSIRARRIVRIVCLLLIEPILWAGLEWVRGWLFTGFAWNYLGTAAAQFPQYALAARFGGVYLVSAMVLVVNGVFATLIERVIVRMLPKEDADENIGVHFIRVTRNLETALPLILVASLVYFGEQDAIRNAPEETIPVKATLVQRNASCVFQQAQKRENPYEEFGALLATCKYSKPDLVVWAESAMSEFGHLKHPRAYDAVRFVEQKTDGAALFTGGDYYCFTNGKRRVYNGGAIYHPKNLQDPDVEIYSKRHLVPFGEYIPLDKWITPLQKLSPIGVSLYPGESTTVKLNLKRVDEKGVTNKTSVTLGPLICFEDTPPSLARASAKDGAQLLVLITNDSWFSYSVEAEQHAWQSVMRSIETGLPMVRAGNSGVTGSITSRGFTNWLYDGNGKLLVDAKGSQTVIVNVPKNPKKTLYVKLGDYPLMFLFLTCLGLLFFPPAKSRIFARD